MEFQPLPLSHLGCEANLDFYWGMLQTFHTIVLLGKKLNKLQAS